MPLSIHLFGPLSIHVYGVMIVLGVVAALVGFKRDAALQKLLSMDQIYLLVGLAIAASVAGGKLLYLCECLGEETSWPEVLGFWNAGFSVLGAFIAAPSVIAWYMYRHRMPIFKSFDRAILYIPLTFAISRLGCFFAGCCFGVPTRCSLAVTYTDPESLAPTHQRLHPTQLYSAFLEFLIFIVLYAWGQKKLKKTGQMFGTYLILMSIERFLVDFLRGDRTLVTKGLSFCQITAAGIGLTGVVILLLASYTTLFGSSKSAHP